MSDFEAQCDCELDSPGVLSHLPVGERLKHWTDWALYLKRRIETHYRPGIAALEAELERVTAVQVFNADWERMYCATNHERISFVGENCPLCRAEAAVEFKDQALDGMHAQLREAEAEARKYKRLCDERADDP